MRHVPRALAKRLDRLSRRAHRFHRFAHHPLCGRYRGELLALGRKTRICRGCALTLSGLVLGVALGSLIPLWRVRLTTLRLVFVLAGLIALAGGAVSLGLRSRSASGDPAQRPTKLVTRLLPATLFALACVLGARSATPLGLAGCALAGLTFGNLYAAYRRRGPDRTPCASCPERTAPNVCSGLAPIVRRERAFVRFSRRLLAP